MSERTIRSDNNGPGPGPREPEMAAAEKGPGAARVLAVAAVCAGVIALAAATFVLSYSGIHQLALQAGVTPRLARGYPLIIDIMLIIVLAAVLSLRGAGVPSKLFAWATLIVVLAAAASANALHAAGRTLPDHIAAVIAAVVPWVLVLLAFALLLAMLRFARTRRQIGARRAAVEELGPLSAGAGDRAGHDGTVVGRTAEGRTAQDRTADEPTADEPAVEERGAEAANDAALAEPSEEMPRAAAAEPAAQPAPTPTVVLSIPRQPGPAAVADADPAFAASVAGPGLILDSDRADDNPAGDEAGADEPGLHTSQTGGDCAAAPDPEDEDEDEDSEPGMPIFHRLRSSPTPPSGI